VSETYDLLIIGGGVNGVGIARDAAGRGLKVLLCEKGDLAGATSSASSKLVHGGLRYLETYEFRLVRESLGERETLLAMAPHIIWPLRFVLPIMPGMRPGWMLRIGLFLYDNLAKRSLLKGTTSLNLRTSLQGKSLRPELTRGFEYSDCWVDDARLVVLNAVDAKERGAVIETRTACVKLDRGTDAWTAQLRSETGEERSVSAKLVVNAAGPWVEEVLGLSGKRPNDSKVRLVKGSHFVTKRLYEGEHAYIFQSRDGRVIFALPYEDDFTLIGTTDEDWSLDLGKPEISDAETDYLIAAVNGYFKAPITREDIVWSYAGVRPLFDDKESSASVVTRDYVFDLDDQSGHAAPILSIFGGKLTTYRKLADSAMSKLAPYFVGLSPSWTARSPLPGGENGGQTARYPWMPEAQLARMRRTYGARLSTLVGDARSLSDLGRHFGADLYEAEIKYLRTHEFAQTAEDILWRRTKLGLRLSTAERADLDAFLS
jgi:glycerol-3-phosphate dehydrogenase